MSTAELPVVGDTVLYRSRTGAYAVPAIVTATTSTLNPVGVDVFEESRSERVDFAENPPEGAPPFPQLRGVPPLSSNLHVHLHVLTPGIPGQRGSAADFADGDTDRLVAENVGGAYQEWDVPPAAEVDGEPVALTPSIDGEHGGDPCAHPPGTWARIAR